MFPRPIYYTEEATTRILDEYSKYLNFFDKDIFLTTTLRNNEDLLTHVNFVIDKAISYLKTFKNNDYVSDVIIRDAIKHYQKFPNIIKLIITGRRSTAYNDLKNEIMPMLSFSFRTFTEMSGHPMPILRTPKSVYRIRASKDVFTSPFESKDLFHVPFDKMHLIGNNRYSLSGFPCLYFSNTIYGCWEELQRPNIEECYISKFNLSSHHFIDLSRTPEEINNSMNIYYEYVTKNKKEQLSEDTIKNFEYLFNDYLFIWPLIFCCSIKVQYQSSVFKPEYILPQLLLEWVIESNMYDGIKYQSTKLPLLEGSIEENCNNLMKNYVIPAREIDKSGYCKESLQKIRMTKPINYSILKLTNRIYPTPIDNGIYNYKDTVFGQLESLLSNYKTEKCFI